MTKTMTLKPVCDSEKHWNEQWGVEWSMTARKTKELGVHIISSMMWKVQECKKTALENEKKH